MSNNASVSGGLVAELRGEAEAHFTDGRSGKVFGMGIFVLQAADELARLQAVVDKLPKYEDTGELFVPGYDDAYVVANETFDDKLIYFVLAAGVVEPKGWAWVINGRGCSVYGPAYSTHEAAEKAKGDSQ